MILYPGWRSFFSSLFCYALFQSRKFCGTFFISGLDFYLQDSCYEGFYFSFLCATETSAKSGAVAQTGSVLPVMSAKPAMIAIPAAYAMQTRGIFFFKTRQAIIAAPIKKINEIRPFFILRFSLDVMPSPSTPHLRWSVWRKRGQMPPTFPIERRKKLSDWRDTGK